MPHVPCRVSCGGAEFHLPSFIKFYVFVASLVCQYILVGGCAIFCKWRLLNVFTRMVAHFYDPRWLYMLLGIPYSVADYVGGSGILITGVSYKVEAELSLSSFPLLPNYFLPLVSLIGASVRFISTRESK